MECISITYFSLECHESLLSVVTNPFQLSFLRKLWVISIIGIMRMPKSKAELPCTDVLVNPQRAAQRHWIQEVAPLSTKIITKSDTVFCWRNFRRFAVNINRDFKMPRGRRQRERQKSNRLNRQNNYSARASRFFIHFFAVTSRLRREHP